MRFLSRRAAATDTTKAATKADSAEVPPNAWAVVHLLMQIDPPPVDGRDWLAGNNDGIYLAQCHLNGSA